MSHPVPRHLLPVPLAIAALLVACGSSYSTSSGNPKPAANVSIVTNAATKVFQAYAPDTFTVTLASGGKVTWRNDDIYSAHTATADVLADSTAGFHTGTLSTSDTATVVFSVAGTYAYHCSIHGTMMRGVVIVTP